MATDNEEKATRKLVGIIAAGALAGAGANTGIGIVFPPRHDPFTGEDGRQLEVRQREQHAQLEARVRADRELLEHRCRSQMALLKQDVAHRFSGIDQRLQDIEAVVE